MIGPQAISHRGQLPAATISFAVRPGHALGDAHRRRQTKAAQDRPHLTISTNFSGMAEAFQGSLGNLWVLLFIAIMVVYLVLGILYESYIHPLTILSGLPSAGFGALVTLWLFHMELNIYAFVGLIMLIGIVKKNAIMQIDFALEAERAGDAPRESHLRRLPHPLPSHHDDHDGRACWAQSRSPSATARAAKPASRSASASWAA